MRSISIFVILGIIVLPVSLHASGKRSKISRHGQVIAQQISTPLGGTALSLPKVDTRCDQLNTLWQTKFHSDFKVNWVREPFLCPSPTATFVEAINYLYYLAGKTINDGTIFPDYYGWITPLITRTEFKETHDHYQVDAVASALNGVLYLHRPYMKYDAIYGATILVHESRHLQKNDPSHVVCSHGVFKDKPYCDERLIPDNFLSGSGHNVEVQFLMWVYLAADKLNLDKNAAKSYLCGSLGNYFNEGYEKTFEQYSCK